MEFTFTLLTIFAVNILLSGDNALVIALASRDLPPKHKKAAILFGSAGAVVLRILLTFVAVYLLEIPYLKVLGGALLIYIAIRLMTGEVGDDTSIEVKSTLSGAIKTIILADVIMSLDNIVAIAGIAKGNSQIIVIGLLTSIPIMIWGSSLISLLIKRFPMTVKIGAGVLGYTAGEMILGDVRLAPLFALNSGLMIVVPLICAFVVIALGQLTLLARTRTARFALSQGLVQGQEQPPTAEKDLRDLEQRDGEKVRV